MSPPIHFFLKHTCCRDHGLSLTMKIHLFHVGQFKGKSPYCSCWVSSDRVHNGPAHSPQQNDLTEVWWFSQFSWHDSVIFQWAEAAVFIHIITLTNFTFVQNALSECLWDPSGLTSYFLDDICNNTLVNDKGGRT